MRGAPDRSPVDIASEKLTQASNRYAACRLTCPFSLECDKALSELRDAAVAYTKVLFPGSFKSAKPVRGKRG